MDNNTLVCSRCGTKNNLGSKFCKNCGCSLGQLPNVHDVEQKVQNDMPIINVGVSESTVQNAEPTLINSMPQISNETKIQQVETPSTNPVSEPISKQQLKKEKKHKHRKIIPIILIILIAIVAVSVIFKKDNNKRAILIYMVGSNLESDSGLATKDLSEIKNSGIDLEHIKVIVYTAGTKTWHGNYKNNAIYELTNDGYKLVKEYSQVNTGTPSTLTEFIDYATVNYKASKYGLIFWNHGGGPIVGYGADEMYDYDALTLTELTSALDNTKYTKNNKFEFIGFDACLMASIEVGSTISKYTDYMIASEEMEPGYGWDYTFFKEVNKDTDTKTLAKHIIDYTYNFYDKLSKSSRKNFAITLSLMDLKQIKNVEQNLSALFKDVDVTLSNNGYSDVVKYITKSKSFGYNGVDNSFDLIDLKEMSVQLENKYGKLAANLTNSIEDLIIYEKSNLDGANGVSIYYPYYTKRLVNSFMAQYEKLNFSAEYKEFLRNHVKILTGASVITSNFKSISLDIKEDKISVTLPEEEIVKNYNKAKYIIFRDMKDGYYMPIYTSSDVELNDSGVLSANFNKKQLAVIDPDEITGFATMIEISRTKDEAIYEIPILLYNYKPEFEIKKAFLIMKIDVDHPNGYIIGAIPYTNPDEIKDSREIINVNDWEVIQFFNSEYKILDKKGNYTTNWEGSGVYYLVESKTDSEYRVELIDLDKDYDYYCLFQIEDTQGIGHYTNLIKIN